MKKLIVLIHPNLHKSKVNSRWVSELERHPQAYHIHNLYQLYPDEKIDILAEQQLIEQYNKIIFQFPFYWFNCPPLFKKWLDEVLTYGWAYGSTSGYKLSDKKIALAISAGIGEDEYAPSGKYNYTLELLSAPFELTFKYIKADYQKPFVYYGIELNSSNEWIEASLRPYFEFLNNF